MSLSFPLYQTFSGTADINGNVNLYNPGPGSGRTWQGTISVLDGVSGTNFAIYIGGQKWGAIHSPGPGGPYQVQANQPISLTATGVTPGTIFTAVLSGVDDPSEGATPYTGPVAVTSVSTGSP